MVIVPGTIRLAGGSPPAAVTPARVEDGEVKAARCRVLHAELLAMSYVRGLVSPVPAGSGPDPQRAAGTEPAVVADVGQDRRQPLAEHLAADTA